MPVAWGVLCPVTRLLDSLWAGTIQYTVTAILSIVFMYCIWKTSLFSFQCKHFWKGLFSFGLLGVLGAIGAFIFSRDMVDLTPTAFTIIGCVALNLAIAVSEEFLFRGVILHSMLRAWQDKKHYIILSVIGCSAIFGIRHLLNLMTSPTAIVLTLAQVIFTFMAGIFLCAVFLRTQNIWICITIHFLEDIAVSIWEIFSSNAAASASLDGSIGAAFGMIALQIPYVIFGILMLRDKIWIYYNVIY
jgi:membrane protease YdiL (CAAX protease family)